MLYEIFMKVADILGRKCKIMNYEMYSTEHID